MRATWQDRRSRVMYAAVGAVALASSGCLALAVAGAGAAGGAVGYAYYNGKVCRTYPARVEDVWAATQTALRELGLPVLQDESHPRQRVLVSRAADGDRIRIAVEMEAPKIPADPPLTRVCIRVATFGDRETSVRILEQIGLHLVPAPAVPLPAQAVPGAPVPLEPVMPHRN